MSNLEFSSKYQAPRIFSSSLENAKEIAALIAAGGIVGIPFGPVEKRIYILATSFDDSESLQRLNEIKGRPKSQTIAIGCLPESTDYFADINNCPALVRAAGILEKQRILDVMEHFYKHPVGLIMRAHDHIPQLVTSMGENMRTVLVIGAIDYQDPNDIYNNVLWELATGYGKAIAGTSANPAGTKAFSVIGQEMAYERFKNSIDAFVQEEIHTERLPLRSHPASTTIIDLTKEYPTVRRWGSTHPERFRKLLPDLLISRNVSMEDGRESDFDLLKERFKRFIGLY